MQFIPGAFFDVVVFKDFFDHRLPWYHLTVLTILFLKQVVLVQAFVRLHVLYSIVS